MRWLATVADSPELATQITENIENVTQQISKTQEYLDKYLPVAIGFGLRLLLTVLLFLVGSRLIKLVRKIVRRSMERAGADVGVTQFMDSLIRAILYFLLVMFLADGIGVDTTSVMALVGSAGLTIVWPFRAAFPILRRRTDSADQALQGGGLYHLYLRQPGRKGDQDRDVLHHLIDGRQ